MDCKGVRVILPKVYVWGNDEELGPIVADIRAGAAYIFRNDSESLECYPSLYARSASKKKPSKVDIEAAAPQPAE